MFSILIALNKEWTSFGCFCSIVRDKKRERVRSQSVVRPSFEKRESQSFTEERWMIFEKSIIIIIIIVQKTTTKRSFGLLRARDTNNIEYLNDDRILTPMTTMQTYPSCDVCVHLFLRNFRVLYQSRRRRQLWGWWFRGKKKEKKTSSKFNTKYYTNTLY